MSLNVLKAILPVFGKISQTVSRDFRYVLEGKPLFGRRYSVDSHCFCRSFTRRPRSLTWTLWVGLQAGEFAANLNVSNMFLLMFNVLSTTTVYIYCNTLWIISCGVVIKITGAVGTCHIPAPGRQVFMISRFLVLNINMFLTQAHSTKICNHMPSPAPRHPHWCSSLEVCHTEEASGLESQAWNGLKTSDV